MNHSPVMPRILRHASCVRCRFVTHPYRAACPRTPAPRVGLTVGWVCPSSRSPADRWRRPCGFGPAPACFSSSGPCSGGGNSASNTESHKRACCAATGVRAALYCVARSICCWLARLQRQHRHTHPSSNHPALTRCRQSRARAARARPRCRHTGSESCGPSTPSTCVAVCGRHACGRRVRHNMLSVWGGGECACVWCGAGRSAPTTPGHTTHRPLPWLCHHHSLCFCDLHTHRGLPRRPGCVRASGSLRGGAAPCLATQPRRLLCVPL
jgi:hypothetical protein